MYLLLFRGWIIAKWDIWRTLGLFYFHLNDGLSNARYSLMWPFPFAVLSEFYTFYIYENMGHILIFLLKFTHLERMVGCGHLQFSNAAKHTHTRLHVHLILTAYLANLFACRLFWVNMHCEYSKNVVVFSCYVKTFRYFLLFLFLFKWTQLLWQI